MKVGIIDIGSNTFNLLIAETGEKGSYQPLYRSKIAVKLGEGGFMKNYITEEAMDRAFVAMDAQIAAIKNQYCDRVHAFATSAVRNATNADLFLSKVKELFGIQIQVISGDREAEMVYHGVNLSGALGDEKSLIMDIGGGSTEFVIANSKEIFWKQSYELGVSRLREKFKPSDPLSAEEITLIESFLENQIADVMSEIKKHNVKHLVGSSGSFDTFCDIISHRKGTYAENFNLSNLPFDMDALMKVLDELIYSSMAEHVEMPGMPEYRIKMIMVSALFTRLVINKADLTSAGTSRYSLKEGVLFDVLQGNL